MEKQISIIIPTYNMEKYISKCLDSLIIPEFDQIEVLVVNDGSKDRSSEIAHSYAERYPDSIRVIDKENGNYGSCINTALPLATGRYVKILDADDTFDKTGFSELVSRLRDLDVDVVFTHCEVIDDQSRTLSVSGKYKNNQYNHIYNEINSRLYGAYTLMHWITYNIRIFKRFEYFQPVGISYTDTIWAFIPIIFCNTGIFLDLIVYKYLFGREGQTMNPKNMAKQISHFSQMAKAMIDYYVRFKEDTSIKEFAKKNTLIVTKEIYNTFATKIHTRESFRSLAEFDKELYHLAPDIYEAISEHNISSSINYKIYKHIRESDFDFNFKIPLNISIRIRLTHYKHSLIARLQRFINLNKRQ